MTYECILTDVRGEGALKTGLITLNRPKQMNALNDQLMDELGQALLAFDADDGIGCIVVTGSEKAFAAGADIAAMKDYDFAHTYRHEYISRNWETMRKVRKPVIAAVAGVALGGGCEVAMMCDMIVAADNARFGQPEITIGVIPGAGGTQRLPRAIGKAKAMDMVLTNRWITAAEADAWGLVSRVVPAATLMDEVIAIAEKINGLGQLALFAAKESVNRAFEGSLNDGLWYERRLFHAMFGTADQREGMAAFLDKRPAKFNAAD
ncbi:MAG: enoyl-CoA hydratase [Burkholderiales bacterium PBB6]|jgi:enoyl-CoA hydratase|nr:MAG: enoyl-CoA hydratase [Burkholderiales bacterium PBB6]